MSNPRRIRPSRTLLHVRKLVPKRRNPTCRKTLRIRLHGRMSHSGAGAMCEQVHGFRLGRPEEEARDQLAADRNSDLLSVHQPPFGRALTADKRLTFVRVSFDFTSE